MLQSYVDRLNCTLCEGRAINAKGATSIIGLLAPLADTLAIRANRAGSGPTNTGPHGQCRSRSLRSHNLHLAPQTPEIESFGAE